MFFQGQWVGCFRTRDWGDLRSRWRLANGTMNSPGMALCEGPIFEYSPAMEPQVASIRSHAERAVPDRAAEILSAGYVAHVGFIEEGRPVVIPLGYGYDAAEPDRLYLHGSTAGRAIQR